MSTLYLYHHGIKGQKWGVRRYQNEIDSIRNLKKNVNKKVKEKQEIKKEKKKLTKGQKIAIGVLAVYGTMSVIAAADYVNSIKGINKNMKGRPFKIIKSIYNPFFFIKELTK